MENYQEESSFDDFYHRQYPAIQQNLKGRKMKKRHLKNASLLLDESTDLPKRIKEDILLEGIKETVEESDSASFVGEEFDHFKFAKKIRKKAIAINNKRFSPIKKRIFAKALRKPAPARSVQNGKLTPPPAAKSPIPSPLPSPAPRISGSYGNNIVSSGSSQMREADDATSEEGIETSSPTKEQTVKKGIAGSALLAKEPSKSPVTKTEGTGMVLSAKRVKMLAITAGLLIVAILGIFLIKKNQ